MLEVEGLIKNITAATHKRRQELLGQRGSQALDIAGLRQRAGTERTRIADRGNTARTRMKEAGLGTRQQAGFANIRPLQEETLRTSELNRDVTQQALDVAEEQRPFELAAAKLGMGQLQETAVAHGAGLRKEGLAPSRVQAPKRIEPIPLLEDILNTPESDPLTDIVGVKPQQARSFTDPRYQLPGGGRQSLDAKIKSILGTTGAYGGASGLQGGSTQEQDIASELQRLKKRIGSY